MMRAWIVCDGRGTKNNLRTQMRIIAIFDKK
jgi:hypothetical protein